MGGYAAGIDCGSTFCKAALCSPERLEAVAVEPTGWDIAETGRRVMKKLAAARPDLSLAAPLAATGYGREKIPGADRIITEITCHARGAEFLSPGVGCVIDIGGQDCKVISVKGGKVASFQMNDKCAAGSGRFLEMVLNRLEVDLALLDSLLSKNRTIPLNSTCAVFAESEIISLLARGVSREEILGGVAASLAAKIAGQAARTDVEGPAALTGGLSGSAGIRAALARELGVAVRPVANGLYAGAIGAACLALERG